MTPFLFLLAGLPRDVVIAQDGRSDWVIVAQGANPALHHGAEELQTFLEKITGARLPISGEAVPGVRAITVREDRREKDEAFTIVTQSSGIEIRGGGKRGAMYGCYGFLQDVLGCRWYTQTVSRIPNQPTLRVPALNIHEAPAFEYREPYFTEALNRDWDLRNRVNGSFMPLDESVGGNVAYGKFVHTFSELVPPEKYFKTHPEYFSLVKGKRQDGYAQLCLTNPDVLKIVIAKVREWIRQNPNATIFSVSQNDADFHCQCDACKLVEKQEGSASGPLLRFVNKVADAIGKDNPKILIDTLAYQWSEKPPKLERPHRNVRVRLAPLGACFAHPLDGCAMNKTPFANLNAWAKKTDQLYVWHYCTDFANYLQPLPDLDELSADVKLFHDHGVVGLFYEGDYAGGGDMAELKSYLLARLMWNPDQPTKPIVDEFLQGVYGPAAPDIQAWLDVLQKGAREQHLDASVYDDAFARYITPDVLTDGARFFDHAEQAVATDPQALEAVRKARLGLQWLEYMRTPESDPLKSARAKVLAAAIRHFGVKETSEGTPAEEFLKKIGQ